MRHAQSILVWILTFAALSTGLRSAEAAPVAAPGGGAPANGGKQVQATTAAPQPGNGQPAQGNGDAWMNFGIDESVIQEAPKKKKITLKGQYFRTDVGVGEVEPIAFRPDGDIVVGRTKDGGAITVDSDELDRKGLRPEINTEAGVRAAIAAGYNFNEYVGVEFEIQAQYARLGSVNIGGGVTNGNTHIDTGGSLWQIPVFVNLAVQYPTPWNLTPFAGVGGGLLFAYTSIDQPSVEAFGLEDQGKRVTGTVLTPAYQWFGGLRWEISKDIGLYGMYKFMATGDYSYNGDMEGIEFDGIETHSYSGGLVFRY